MITGRIADITTLAVDAIVNAANSHLAPGGGVCGAIHRAAGPELAAACRAIGGCATGDARTTPGFRLPARYVIHAVGPVWGGGGEGEAALLASAYRSVIREAAAHGCTIVAVPSISTGIYGYPLEEAAPTAVAALRSALEVHPQVHAVIIACMDERTLGAYVAAGAVREH